MAYEQRDNSGSLFKNDRKDSDRHPDYTGSAMIDGVDYWMSAWIKQGNGKTFMSFAFKPKQERQPQPGSSRRNSPPPRERTARRSLKDDMSDEIPF